jgi:hypothetical protein
MEPLKVARWSERLIAFLLGAIVATLIILFGIPAANAQTIDLDSTAVSGANSDSASVSGASANSNQSSEQGNVQATMLNFEAAAIPHKTTQKFKTNANVPLAASVSFSSDYCGGTASAGASGFGLSLGAAIPKMDGNCQALRRAEKFGVAAANAYSAGLTDMAGMLIAMQTWEICMAGNDAVTSLTAEACEQIGLLGEGALSHQPPAHGQLPHDPPQIARPSQQRGTMPPSAQPKQEIPQKVRVRGGDGREVEVDLRSAPVR